MTKMRVIGCDILRIFAMICVTAIHFTEYSGVSRLSFNDLGLIDFIFVKSLQSFTLCFVDIFVLLTGYFMVSRETSLKKILIIWGEVIFVGVFMIIVCNLIGESISYKSIIKSRFPVTSGSYWFINTYFLLYLIIPILNQMIRHNMIHRTLIVMSLIIMFIGINPFMPTNQYIGPSTGIFWFSYIYLIGAYIRIYGTPYIPKLAWAILGVGVYIIILILLATGIKLPYNIQLLSTNNTLPLILSISIFMLLKDLNFDNKFVLSLIPALSVCSLNVYLIQESEAFRSVLWRYFDATIWVGKGNGLYMILMFLTCIVCLWIGAFVTHKLYVKLLLPLIGRMNEKYLKNLRLL